MRIILTLALIVIIYKSAHANPEHPTLARKIENITRYYAVEMEYTGTIYSTTWEEYLTGTPNRLYRYNGEISLVLLRDDYTLHEMFIVNYKGEIVHIVVDGESVLHKNGKWKRIVERMWREIQ